MMRCRYLAAIGLLALAALSTGLLIGPRWVETYNNGLQAAFFGHPFTALALPMR